MCDSWHCWPAFKDMKMQIERARYSHGEGVQLRGSMERRKPWQRNFTGCLNPQKGVMHKQQQSPEQGAIGTPSSTGHLSTCSEIVDPGSRENPSQYLELKRWWCLWWNTIFVYGLNQRRKWGIIFWSFYTDGKKKSYFSHWEKARTCIEKIKRELHCGATGQKLLSPTRLNYSEEMHYIWECVPYICV